ncbi:NAD(P)-dependent oxidoreductase [Maritimibacter fusiformis]|uniref:NAD(P)-dependent oxidoreductase n=1 Tax=Maritimibacter fusiformis TaxID=2603819 RepID=A0A5D0RLD1_9RHOB|nr:NAD(P)-dependent oxidoreductase [Maritimibacter fusiformis]TYB82322.1 NAD(P)-dependent oxidoreductase [Maritimibacter fusiformis]
MTQSGPVGFIGLGVMGGAMARRLIGAGYEVHIHARNPDRAAPVLALGAHWAGDIAALARTCRTIFTIVGGPDDVAALYLGEAGLIANAAPGTVLVDMTTSTPDLARRIASEAASRGVSALDAPVTGGAPGAEVGTLTFMVGGDTGALDAVRPMLWTMGATIFAMGPAGSGQITKASNQVAVAGILMGLAEALHHAETAGIAPEKVLEVLMTGTAGGPLMQRLGPKMVAGDSTASFAIDHFIKDLGIALDTAPLPGAALCRDLYRDLAAEGGGAKGIQALIEHYRRS